MASKRDLVEAHAFNRRRLVTAFLSGAPGGREVEPVRYARPLVGGVIVAALVVGGAAVTGVLKPAVPKDWLDNGLVIGKDSGSRFVAVNKNLYPVANTTSARLILAESKEFKVTYVPDALIRKQKSHQTLGIVGAPDTMPKKSELVQTGWTACTNRQLGVKIRVATTAAAAAAPREALVVKSATDGEVFVVTGSRRYAVPSGSRGDAVLLALGLNRQSPYKVPAQWLDLVTLGKPLEFFSVPDIGKPSDAGLDSLDTIGTPVRVGKLGYVLTAKGLVPLTEFAYSLYKVTAATEGLDEETFNAAQIQGGVKTLPDLAKHTYPADWPSSRVSPFTGGSPCLELRAGNSSIGGSEVSSAVLAKSTSDAAIPVGSRESTDIQQGHGAMVRAATADTVESSATVFYIDALGTRYAVGEKGKAAFALTALGFPRFTPTAIPQPWTKLFGDGPALTYAAATKAAQQ